ncbi:hypothetical protein ACSSVW_001983 [Pseudoalteromonas sp. MBR-15]
MRLLFVTYLFEKVDVSQIFINVYMTSIYLFENLY